MTNFDTLTLNDLMNQMSNFLHEVQKDYTDNHFSFTFRGYIMTWKKDKTRIKEVFDEKYCTRELTYTDLNRSITFENSYLYQDILFYKDGRTYTALQVRYNDPINKIINRILTSKRYYDIDKTELSNVFKEIIETIVSIMENNCNNDTEVKESEEE